MRYYDNTMLSAFKTCPQFYQLRHKKGWRRDVQTSKPLAFGLSWHEAMDFVWINKDKLTKNQLLEGAVASFLERWLTEGQDPAGTTNAKGKVDKRSPETAVAMIDAYLDARRSVLQSYELIAAEIPFTFTIGVPNVMYSGNKDKVVRDNYNRIMVMDHKTTSDYRIDGGFSFDFIQSWSMSDQLDGYCYDMSNGPMKGALIDAALVHDKVRDFKLIPIEKSAKDLDRWFRDAADWIVAIEAAEYYNVYNRNRNNCIGKYGKCTFFDVCEAWPYPAGNEKPPEGFIVDFWNPLDHDHNTLNLTDPNL